VTDGLPDSRPLFHKVCRVGEIREKEGRCFLVEYRSVAVFLENGVYSAVSDRCPHNGMALHDGSVVDGVVTCRWHGWQFELRTGRPPGNAPEAGGPSVRVYEVRIRDGWIEVSAAGSAPRPPASTPPGP
jgi:nitrite reductase/ring-hydroxylating ferredoxin subunit